MIMCPIYIAVIENTLGSIIIRRGEGGVGITEREIWMNFGNRIVGRGVDKKGRVIKGMGYFVCLFF